MTLSERKIPFVSLIVPRVIWPPPTANNELQLRTLTERSPPDENLAIRLAALVSVAPNDASDTCELVMPF